MIAVTLLGCSAAPSDDPGSAEAELGGSGAAIGAGHWVATDDGGESARWLVDMMLLPDGSFSGTFGSNISNVSGHRYDAAGRWKTKKHGTETILEMTYGFDDAPDVSVGPPDEFVVHAGAHGAVVGAFDDGSGTLGSAFTIARKGRVDAALVHFDADWTTHLSGHVVAGGMLGVHYAPSRQQCAHEAESVTLFVRGDHGAATPVRFPMQRGGDHFVAVPVPNAHRIELWFQNTGENCAVWDSDYGHNYAFDVASAP